MRMAAAGACIALARVANAGSLFNAGRDFYVELDFVCGSGFASARGAGIADDGARACAGAARAGHGEEALLVANLAAPLALAANVGTAA